MNALASKSIQVAGQSSNQRFAFAGLHFGDPPLMKDDSTDQLDVEVTHVQHASPRFSGYGERLDQDVVQTGAVGESLLEIDRFSSEIGIRQLLQLRLQVVDSRNEWTNRLDLPVMFGAKNLGESAFEHN